MIAGHSEEELAVLPGSEGMSLKEVIHHLTESNIVAATMVIAALGADGCTFDWSWLWPNRAWFDTLGYIKAPLGPSIKTLHGLIPHVSNLVAAGNDTLTRKIQLFDTPGGEKYQKTIAEIIRQEIDHAAQHLADARRF